MKTIFLGWIHGVGKSTLIQWLMKGKEHIWHFSFWENVREIGENSGKVKNIKDLSWLSNETRLLLMKEAKERFRKMIARQLYETLLVDNHFSVYENKKLVKAIDEEDLELYDTFILVDVPTDILYTRISQDSKQRTNESCDREKIEQHRAYERSIAEELRNKSNISFMEIENIELAKSIERIQRSIDIYT